MRIFHVMAGAREGGAETMMLDGVLALAEAGAQQGALIRPDNTQRVSALGAAGVDVTTASFGNILRFETTAKLDAALDRFAPDVIHCWMGRAGSFAPARWRERSVGWYGGYYKLSRFRNCAWQAGVTSDIAHTIVEQGAPQNRVSVLHCYANVEPAPPIDRATLNTPADAPVVLALARLHEKKGIDVLLSALAKLPGVYGWIAGSGPLEQVLKAQASQLGISERVRFLGWRTDRSALLAACDAVAFPSRYEPFGVVTIEAWACGKPLVVADSAGPAATVKPEIDAILVPKDDPAALAAGLKRVLDDRALAQNLVAAGRAAYEAEFTRAAFVRNAMALYERIIAAASPTS